jgi:YbbR domain-containing protein
VRGPGSVGVQPRIVDLGPNLSATMSSPTVAVAVSGPLADVLALKPSDVSVTLDASGLGPGTYRLEPRVTAPPGISVEGTVPDRVEVVIGGQR